MNVRNLIDKLNSEHILSAAEFSGLLDCQDETDRQYLFSLARSQTEKIFGTEVYIRGLIEFSNYCRNDCYYCGIRRSNTEVERYRLSDADILSCCTQGHTLGFRTFVLQSGEDMSFSCSHIVSLITEIKRRFPDCAVTLSIGEKTEREYEAYRRAGADRYLLRHETADRIHYTKLKPPELTFEHRRSCLYQLKKLGFQTGCGFMVGSPFQTKDCLIEDLQFIHDFNPEMIGIGPFIPHHSTPFRSYPAGSVSLTLLLTGILRLMQPYAL